MNPYVHATFTRGEGFRCDDITDIDKFAAKQAVLMRALDQRENQTKKQKLTFLQWLRKFFVQKPKRNEK